MFSTKPGKWIVGVAVLFTVGVARAVDIDGDGVNDPFDVCCNTPPGTLVDGSGRPIGDFDLDCDNDLADFAIYTQGYTGPLAGPTNCTCATHQDCDDGEACTQDQCVGGQCQYTPIPNCGPCANDAQCDDGDDCTIGLCVAGTCQHNVAPDNTPCNDSDACTDNDMCISGVCMGTPIPNCGTCTMDADCLDADPCTQDLCVASQCQNNPLPEDSPCNDGNACTTNDLCNGTGQCVGQPTDCNDGVYCTADTCDGQTGQCVFVPNTGAPCDDNNPCTIADTCDQDGGCSGQPKDCSAMDTQCVVGVCQVSTGQCVAQPLPAGTPCDDGNPGTIGDACDGSGQCIGALP